MSERVLRSHSTPVAEEIELIDTENGLVGHVVEPGVLVGQGRQANRGRSVGRARGRGRGRGRGRVSPSAATQTPLENPRRARGRTGRRAKSVERQEERSVSRHDSSGSAHVEGQGFVTQEAFNDKMGKIETALNNLLEMQEKSMARSKSGTELTGPIPTVVGGQPLSTPAAVEIPRSTSTKGCSYKEFAACKPPSFKGERDPILASRWVREMEIVFDTCKCAENDKVIFALSVLKADAIYWWDMESGGRASQVAKTTTWEDFTKSFQEQFCPTVTIIRLEEEF